ncbi:hypothetical protein COY23_01695 [bacterium (Candidatus Torokbacteria) CG_4_10_14_0_2_um_filter_35_8]|nr:MAG: hypothetical protein COY23_01695 [bacterium (Candidatus Torokbacteria) CG_4_10_14_0_2_um_filter_35_8]
MSQIKKSIRTGGLSVILTLVILGGLYILVEPIETTCAETYTAGDVIIEYPWSGSIFYETNFAPGQCVVKNVTISNTSSDKTYEVGTQPKIPGRTYYNYNYSTGSYTPPLSDVIKLKISEGSSTIYENYLSGFYTFDYPPIDETILLAVLGPGENTIVQFSGCMDIGAGEEYQSSDTVFDVIFRFNAGEVEGDHAGPSGEGGEGGKVLEAKTGADIIILIIAVLIVSIILLIIRYAIKSIKRKDKLE